MKTVFACLMSFVFGVIISVAAFMSPGNTGVAEFGYNILIPKADFERVIKEHAEARQEAAKAKEEFNSLRDKWYNKTGEWLEDLF